MILIAGGTGRLGTVLGTRPTQRGLPVRVLTRDPARAAHLTGLAVEVVTGDVRDPASLAAAVHGADVVVSAVQGFAGSRPVSPVTVDARGNGNLIDATRQTGAHFVLMSAVGAAAGSPMELFRMKHPAEQHLQASGGGWTIVRATAFIESWIAVLSQTTARSGRPVVFGRGNNPINFVSVTDVAALVERAVTDRATRGRILEIGGPANVTFNELAAAVQAANGRTSATRHVPPPILRLIARTLAAVKPEIGRRPAPPSPWIASTSPTTRPPSTRPTPACPARPCSRRAQRLKTHGHAPGGHPIPPMSGRQDDVRHCPPGHRTDCVGCIRKARSLDPRRRSRAHWTPECSGHRHRQERHPTAQGPTPLQESAACATA
jgi:NADH dehydrogenase